MAYSGIMSDPRSTTDHAHTPHSYSSILHPFADTMVISLFQDRCCKWLEARLASGRSGLGADDVHVQTHTCFQICKSHVTRNSCRSLFCNYCALPLHSLSQGNSLVEGLAHYASLQLHEQMSMHSLGHNHRTTPNVYTSPSCISRFDFSGFLHCFAEMPFWPFWLLCWSHHRFGLVSWFVLGQD